ELGSLAAKFLPHVDRPNRPAVLRVEAADLSRGRGVIESARVPRGSGIGTGVRAAGLPRPIDALAPDLAAGVGVEGDREHARPRLEQRKGTIACGHEAGVTLAQFARPE